MKTIVSAGTLALALLAVGIAPAAAQNREHQQMAAELRILQEQTQQLALTLAQLNDALKALNARMDASDKAAVKNFADQSLVIDGVTRELSVVREATQDTGTRIRRVAEELDALRTSLPAMLAQLAPPAPAIDPSDPDAAAAAAAAPPPPVVAPLPPAGTSPSRMYDTAWADYTSSQWSLAIAGFEQFLKTFPQSDRADDSQFFIGESYFQQSRFADAIAAYNLVVQNYPGGDQAANAYYKRGRAQQRLGDLESARESWETVIKSYPDDTAAILAKQGLDGLGPPPPQPPG